MKGRSRTSVQLSFWDLPNVTFLQELGDGAKPYVSQLGLTTNPSGQVHVPANLSARLAKEKGLLTSGTSGPPGIGSSASASLTQFLESKLRQRMGLHGSTLFRLTWKTKTTPSRRSYSQLVASAHSTSDKDSGSWPSPMAGTPKQKGYNEAGNTDSSRKTVWLANWRSPDANNRGGGYSDPDKVIKRQKAGHQVNLEDQAVLSSWPTTRATDGSNGGPNQAGGALTAAAHLSHWRSPTEQSSRGSGPSRTGNKADLQTQASWATPAAQEPGGTPEQFLKRKEKHPCGQNVTALSLQAQLSTWQTPTVNDAKGSDYSYNRGNKESVTLKLPGQAKLSGPMSSGSPAETASPGQLSPAFSLWLMGYDTPWESAGLRALRSCVERETPSSRKSRPK